MLFSLGMPLVRGPSASGLCYVRQSAISRLLCTTMPVIGAIRCRRVTDVHMRKRGRDSPVLLEARIVEFIPIKSWVTKGSGAPGSCAGHNRVPSRDRGRPPSTDGSGLSQCGSASHYCSHARSLAAAGGAL